MNGKSMFPFRKLRAFDQISSLPLLRNALAMLMYLRLMNRLCCISGRLFTNMAKPLPLFSSTRLSTSPSRNCPMR